MPSTHSSRLLAAGVTPLRLISSLLATVALLIASLSISSPAYAIVDKDCSDFNTQAQAQNFFNDHNPSADPHQLDADGDGVACESNPCPCSTGGGGGGGGDGTGGGGGGQPDIKRQKARVIRVVDGDTVKVKIIRGPRATVRVLGIDTPEVYGGEECYGPEASRATKRMLPRGTRVRITSDPSQDFRDRYGRLLRYITKGKTDVGRRLVYRGAARVYVYNHNPFRRVEAYRTSQRSANSHNRGLWGSC